MAITLTPTEKKIYDLLKNRSPGVVDPDEIYQKIYGIEPDDPELARHCARPVISRMRKKLPAGSIFSIRGEGYSLSQMKEIEIIEKNSGKARLGKYDGAITVISCPSGPLGEPEFSSGSIFDRDSFRKTLKMGYFPDGMVFAEKGKKYKIQGGEKVEI